MYQTHRKGEFIIYVNKGVFVYTPYYVWVIHNNYDLNKLTSCTVNSLRLSLEVDVCGLDLWCMSIHLFSVCLLLYMCSQEVHCWSNYISIVCM